MRTKTGPAVANVVLETVSDLQRRKLKASMKDIKAYILEKYGIKSDKFVRLIPVYIRKGVNLGLIAKYGKNYRTQMYVARRRKGGKRRRRSRRSRSRRKH